MVLSEDDFTWMEISKNNPTDNDAIVSLFKKAIALQIGLKFDTDSVKFP